MKKDNLLILLASLTVLLFSNRVFGQTNYYNVKLKVRQTERYYWQEIEFYNNNNTFRRFVNPYNNNSIIDSIPNLSYTATLTSVFGDKVQKPYFPKKTKKLTFSVSEYYSKDTSTILFLNRLENNDTIKIYVYQTGCWGGVDFPCSLIKKKNIYYIGVNTQDEYIEYALSTNEIDKLITFENSARQKGKINNLYSTTSTLYSWVFDKEIIEFRINGPDYISEIIRSRKQK